MSRDLIVPISSITEVLPHPNADRLQIVKLEGCEYPMVIGKDSLSIGDKIVYFPADCLLPDVWAVKFNVKAYLKGKDGNRVGRVELRGEHSFGLVVPVPNELLDKEIGENVADFFDCEKYEPPIVPRGDDAAEYDSEIDSFLSRYTDIQDGWMLYRLFNYNEPVIATEKINGTSSKISYINKLMVAGSMGRKTGWTGRRNRPVDYNGVPVDYNDLKMRSSPYWFPWTLEPVRGLMGHLSTGSNVVIMYGEVFGRSVTVASYGIEKGNGFGYRAFDIRVNGKYLDYDEFATLCDHFGVLRVPVLYEGPFDLEKIKGLADGPTTLMEDNPHGREGIVVRTRTERRSEMGRMVLKFVGHEYESRNGNITSDV